MDVFGRSPIWLKLGMVNPLDPKPPKTTLFCDFKVIKVIYGHFLPKMEKKFEFFLPLALLRWLL